MMDPKTAWLLTKTIFNLLFLLLKTSAIVGILYFALFITSFITPFFAANNEPTCKRESDIVYYCCFLVIGFLLLLLTEQLTRLLLSMFPSGGACFKRFLPSKPGALWVRLTTIGAVALLLAAILFGTLYPFSKALGWRAVFAAAGRADLEKSALALAVFMGITLGVGMVTLLRATWGLVRMCFGACRRRKERTGEAGLEGGGIPLQALPSFHTLHRI